MAKKEEKMVSKLYKAGAGSVGTDKKAEHLGKGAGKAAMGGSAAKHLAKGLAKKKMENK
jgi:hypothetical protein